jgi:hypothetical protein
MVTAVLCLMTTTFAIEPVQPLSTISVFAAYSAEPASDQPFGHALIDEHGIKYHFFGFSFEEDFIYPPEYWGVYPLYFGLEITDTLPQDAPVLTQDGVYCSPRIAGKILDTLSGILSE